MADYLLESWKQADRLTPEHFIVITLVTTQLIRRIGDSYVMRLFRSIRGKEELDKSTYWKLCNELRWTFAKQTDNDNRHFRVHFLGLWDTVSSVGWAWEPISFPFTATNPSDHIACHAISIDERRAFFRQNRLALDRVNADQDWKEVSFPGVHSDVGGGYPVEESRLWLVAFDWMVREPRQHGLLVNDSRLPKVRNPRGEELADPWAEPAHESLQGKWWPAEFYPKRRFDAGGIHYSMNRARGRHIRNGELLHESELRRIQHMGYRPRNLSDSFIENVKRLSTLPPTHVVNRLEITRPNALSSRAYARAKRRAS